MMSKGLVMKAMNRIILLAFSLCMVHVFSMKKDTQYYERVHGRNNTVVGYSNLPKKIEDRNKMQRIAQEKYPQVRQVNERLQQNSH